MAAITNPTRFTSKEYLALEAVAELRHEFVRGQIIAMAGAELAHNQVVQNVRTELALALGDRPCRILGSDQRVLVEATGEYFYPDVLVICAEPRLVEPRPRSLVNPEVIIEVLSETTEAYDRGDKWLSYREIPTLSDYVMISAARRELEHYRRGDDGTWLLQTVRAQGSGMLVGGVALELAKLYRLVPGLE